MIHFTIVDYWRYQAMFPLRQAISDTQENYEIKKVHQYQDKIFKEILDDKIEFIHFMKRYTPYQLKENEVEKYNRKFITSHFTIRESDIIYKIKGRNVFIILEHQSKMDFTMPERMLEYCVELMRSVIKNRKADESYPLICPIVLYTGKKKWTVPRTITGLQEKYYNFEPLDYPKYNLVDINDYTVEELIDEKSSVAKAMLFQKIRTKKGVTKMTDVERLFIEVIDENLNKFFAGMDEGKKQIITNMIKMKISDKIILEAAKIKPKELQKIKKELEAC